MRLFASALLFGASLFAQHPRLFVNQERMAQLKSALQTTHAGIWPALRARADAIMAKHPPAYAEGRDSSGEQQNWQMTAGSNLPYLATAYVMTGDRKYFDAAKEWTLASCSYPHWGSGRADGADLAAGYQLLGVAVVYDWLYNDLDASARNTFRRTLAERGRLMFKQSSQQYWRDWTLQNHRWISLAGLAAAAFVLTDDLDAGAEAKQWIAAASEKFRQTEALLQTDGASQEGLTYWSLGMDGLLRFWALSKDLLGENLTSKFWANTGYYRLYLSLPRHSWTVDNKVVDFADCIRTDWLGPDYLLRRMAALNHDPYLQWLAEATAPVSNCERFGACWLNLVWHDPDLPAKSPESLPTVRHFEDLGIVSARSDWSGDESLVAFKCGPALGHTLTSQLKSDPGGAHAHPDANHFVLFGSGEWLIRDDGYRFKSTINHNTLLIDGKGQIGGDSRLLVGTNDIGPRGMWFAALDQIRAQAHPRVIAATSAKAFDYIAGDATEAYQKDAGLRRFVRRMIFLKPDVLIVVDDVEAEPGHTVELRFHPQIPATADGDAYVSRGSKAVLRLEPLTIGGAQVTAGMMEAADMLRPARDVGLDKREDPRKLYTIRLESTQPVWRSAVALSWSASDRQPVKVSVAKTGKAWIFQAGKRSVGLDGDGSAPRLR